MGRYCVLFSALFGEMATSEPPFSLCPQRRTQVSVGHSLGNDTLTGTDALWCTQVAGIGWELPGLGGLPANPLDCV